MYKSGMTSAFQNIRSPKDTLDRMVLSVVNPRHPEAYVRSCYGHVCHAIRKDQMLQPQDQIVLLGSLAQEGVIHAILVSSSNQIIVDACADNAVLEGDTYRYKSTPGVQATEMVVRGRQTLAEFGINCLKYISSLEGVPLNPQSLQVA